MKLEIVELHTAHHREDRLLALRERAGLSRRPFPLANALAYHLKMCKLRRIEFRGTGLRNVQSLTLCSNSQNMHGLFGVFQSINIWQTDIWSSNERTYISVGQKQSICPKTVGQCGRPNVGRPNVFRRKEAAPLGLFNGSQKTPTYAYLSTRKFSLNSV